MRAVYTEFGSNMDFTATDAVAAGELVIVGTIAGVAGSDIAAGETGALILGGVFTCPKDSAEITQGAKVYYDSVADVVTATESGNTLIGFAFTKAAASDATVAVKLYA